MASWQSDKRKKKKEEILTILPQICAFRNKDRNTKRQMYSLIEMWRKTATRERICSGSWELISSVRLFQITAGWTEWGAVAQDSCCVTVSETGFGNVQRFSAIPLSRPHSPVLSASGELLGKLWTGLGQASCSNKVVFVVRVSKPFNKPSPCILSDDDGGQSERCR